MKPKRTLFIAGIIQGSCMGREICSQDYRGRLSALLRDVLPEWNVFCPIEEYPGSPDYDSEKAEQVFFDLMNRAGRADVIVAYLPQASLGTAIELWQAYNAKKTIFTISPMTENWVIRFLTTRNFTSLEAFEAFVRNGEFMNMIQTG